jgi:hypothetical protein
MGLVSLTNRHPATRSNRPARWRSPTAPIGCVTSATCSSDRGRRTQQQFEFAAEHPLIRSLTDYSKLVHALLKKRPYERRRIMNESLQTALTRLRLSGLAASLDVRLQEAAGHHLGHASSWNFCCRMNCSFAMSD